MPSTATITSFYYFTSGTIYTSEVNANFNAIRGHFIPLDPNTTTAAATATYDLGSNDHAWDNVFSKSVMLKSTNGVGITAPSTGFVGMYVDYTSNTLYLVNDSNTSYAIPTVSNTLTLINKWIDGRTATAYSRITVPKETTTNLNALARVEGNLYYSTSENKYYGDNGSNLIGIGGGSWAVSSQTLASGGYISLTSGEVNQRITVTGNTTTGSTLTTTLFGNSAPTDGTFVRVVGGSNSYPLYIVASDTTYGAIGFDNLVFNYGVVGQFQYNNTLQRWVYG